MADYQGNLLEGDPKTLHMNVPERIIGCRTAQDLQKSPSAIFFEDRSTAEAHGYTHDCPNCDFTGY